MIGYARAPSFAVNKHIEEGRLLHLLPEYKSLPERSVYAIYPEKISTLEGAKVY